VTRAQARTIALQPAPAAEDAARADWYALVGRLFHSPPDAALLSRIAAAVGEAVEPGPASELERAFGGLAQASGQAAADAVRAEYETAFLGVGKPEVFLQASYYLAGFLHERPLAELRARLAELGVARRGDVSETEDHVAALCEVMRLLITSEDPALSGLDTQRSFFSRFLSPWCDALCDAVEHAGSTDYYKHVGRLARAFFAVERQAFDFDS
jgi:TorA maturation chaperone TorD